MKDKLFDAISPVLSQVAEIAGYLWQKGWAERNAGNISVKVSGRLSQLQLEQNDAAAVQWQKLEEAFPAIGNEVFLVTGTGKRMRDIAVEPENNTLVIRLNASGNSMSVLSENHSPDLRPTSELPTHLAIHNLVSEKGFSEKVVLHSHPNELISLTHNRDYCNEGKLNRLLWGMHPETIVMVPEGVGFVPCLLPGSQEIARATLEKFRDHKIVVWEKHGCFAIGREVADAFDLMDTISKSAVIYLQCRSAGFEPEGLSGEQLALLKQMSAKFIL